MLAFCCSDIFICMLECPKLVLVSHSSSLRFMLAHYRFRWWHFSITHMEDIYNSTRPRLARSRYELSLVVLLHIL
jgi:hypothetical protein